MDRTTNHMICQVNQLIMLQKAPKLQTKERVLRPEKVEDLQTTDVCIDGYLSLKAVTPLTLSVGKV